MGRRVATKARRRASPRHRCSWATREPLLTYHDIEWGTPLHDDRLLFEFLILEGMQAGLSWETVLRKRDAFRRAFARFDPIKVAQFTSKDVARLMKDETIIRNRAKIEAAIGNSKDLKKRGFRFVGPTIVESFMQAVGIRNDHERTCYRWAELTRRRTSAPTR
ncbi:MAG: DNA-3-methyladenine glycosylase I [Chloroflexi bacterium]|nr:MAG: DNA-3-methyladenine glycosylase I [Chloroflexota bacterium]